MIIFYLFLFLSKNLLFIECEIILISNLKNNLFLFVNVLDYN